MICVLGMHRSGTSLATRALHLLGVSLGPDEHLMRPRADNPLGFFEHQPLTDLNDEILLAPRRLLAHATGISGRLGDLPCP